MSWSEEDIEFLRTASVNEVIARYGGIACRRSYGRENPMPGQNDPFAPRSANGSGGDEFIIGVGGTTAGGGLGFPLGVWPARLKKVERTTSAAGNTMLVWHFDGVGGDARGRSGRLHTVIFQETEKNWALRQTCESFGIPVSNDQIRIVPSEIEGSYCAVVVEMQSGRDGINRPSIQRTLHWSQFGDEQDFIEAAERLGLSFQEAEPEPVAQPAARPVAATRYAPR